MRRFALLLSVALVAASAPVLSPAASAAPPNGAPPAAAEPAAVPDQLLVGYDIGTSAAERADARGQAGARRIEDVVRGDGDRRAVELVALPSGTDRGAAIRRFEQNPNVAYAEPNWIVTHDAVSDDPYYEDGSLWGMYGDAEGTPPKTANAFGSQAAEAWAAGNTGADSVVVGVIDEGIDISHPDLANNIWVNPGEVAGNGVDDDQNGFVDDVNGWDFHNNDRTVYDGTGDDHGTHVAGTIAGNGGNGRGVAGVAWNATLIPAKFLGPNGGYTDNAVKAIDYLTDLKTRHELNLVASNNSWGGGGYSKTLYDAIERANKAGILFVAAAGNDSANNDATDRYPSGYANTNIIAVASIDSSGALSSFSNYGATTVDLGAPGSGIYSTLPAGKYGSYSGTSMATPHVTGGIVLAYTQTPGLDVLALRNSILSKTVATPSLDGRTATGGRLDVSTFGQGSTSVGNAVPTTGNDAYATQEGTTLSVAAPGVLGNDLDPDDDLLSATVASPPQNGTLALDADGSFSYKPNRKFIGRDSFTYTADDGRGGTAPATVTIDVEAGATKGGGGGDKGGGKPSGRGNSTK